LIALEDRASTWGTVPFGTSRVQVRHIVFFTGVALWLVPTLVMTGIQGIVWFSFNLAFVLILTIIATPFRTVSLQRLITCFFAGGLAMGLTALVCLPLGAALSSSPLRPFFIVPIEELFKLLPVILLLWRGRKFSVWTLGATDLLLMGAFCGAGFAFVEDAYAHAASNAGLNNLSVWLPSSELINGRIVSGHGVWTGLAAATIGLGWLFRHLGKAWLIVAASGFVFASLDHLALNYNLTPGAPGWLTTFFNFISGNGVLPLVLFLAALVLVAAADTFVQLRSLPAAREFKLPTRKDRKETIQALWDCILDLRRLAYAHFRYKNLEVADRGASLSLTVALLTKRLINRYLEVEPQQTINSHSHQAEAEQKVDSTVLMSGQKQTAEIKPSGLAIRGPENKAMPRVAGQAAPPDFGKLIPAGGIAINRPLIEILDLPEHYEILEEVSEGGMGVIFRGRHKRTGARLAIKVMHPHLSHNQTHLRRFEQEARTASTLHHPNIVIVHDFGVTPSSIAYLVMEWLDGSNLDPVIRVGGTLPLDRFLTIFMQATSALAHAHRKGVVHRDIKPSNIILATSAEKTDFVKIVDFGIAKVLSDETEPDMNLTRTGDILGSPLFMSPEQCLGNKMDARSDIYSLGCVMYEALVGVTPLSGANAVQLIYKHVHEMPKQPRLIKADIALPEVMEPLLFKCLQKDPEQRFASMEELEAELKRVQEMLR
jgi:tRNA A-37 threonylcarbamoyl transferase component Bud32